MTLSSTIWEEYQDQDKYQNGISTQYLVKHCFACLNFDVKYKKMEASTIFGWFQNRIDDPDSEFWNALLTET